MGNFFFYYLILSFLNLVVVPILVYVPSFYGLRKHKSAVNSMEIIFRIT